MNKKLKQVYLLRIVCWLSLTTEHIEILHLKQIFLWLMIKYTHALGFCCTLQNAIHLKYFEKKPKHFLLLSLVSVWIDWKRLRTCLMFLYAVILILSWFLSSHQQHSTCNKTRGECPCNYLYSPFEVDLLPPSMHQSCSMM